MTRNKVGAGLFMFLCAGTSGARADCAPVTAPEVAAAEAQRYVAQTAGDFDSLEKIIGEDLVYIHSDSTVDGKASYLDSMRSGAVRYRAMRLLESNVRIFDCLAIMTGSARFEVTASGQDISVDLRFTAGWAKRHGRLEFVSWQSTRIQQ